MLGFGGFKFYTDLLSGDDVDPKGESVGQL
jgi:hypothetical protein